MNEMLEKYFLRKEEERKVKEKIKKDQLLISEGLYEEFYSESEQMYKKIPIEVTDAEYLKIIECSTKMPVVHNENVIAKIIKKSAIILFFLNFIGSIFLSALTTFTSYYSGNTYLEIDFDEFNWAIFLSLVIVSFFGCLLMYAIGEIVDKLDRIEKKRNDV